MVFLVVAEVLVPSGSVPPPYEWPRIARRQAHRTRRYGEIARIAARHGLGRALRGRWRGRADPVRRAALARSLTAALEEGGVTFVKLGQLLSTRRDLLPAEFVDELGRLQDQAAPAPWPAVERGARGRARPAGRRGLRRGRAGAAGRRLGRPGARAPGCGRASRWCVKVQRPGIAAGGRAGPRHRAPARPDAGREHRPGAASIRGRASWPAASPRRCGRSWTSGSRRPTWPRWPRPRRRDPASGSRGRTRRCAPSGVLVMERLDGMPLAAAGPLLAGAGRTGRRSPARCSTRCCGRCMLHGVFHADPHPGNVLLARRRRRSALLDFGSVGRLDVTLRDALRRLLAAIDRGDPVAVSDALLEVVPRPDEIDERRAGAGGRRGHGPAPRPAAGPPGVRLFADLFRVVAGYGLAVPPEVAAVFRALATRRGHADPAGARLRPGRRGPAVRRRAARRAAAVRLAARSWPPRRAASRCCRCCAGCRAGSTGSPTRWSTAGCRVNVRLFADERDRAVRHRAGPAAAADRARRPPPG